MAKTRKPSRSVKQPVEVPFEDVPVTHPVVMGSAAIVGETRQVRMDRDLIEMIEQMVGTMKVGRYIEGLIRDLVKRDHKEWFNRMKKLYE